MFRNVDLGLISAMSVIGRVNTHECLADSCPPPRQVSMLYAGRCCGRRLMIMMAMPIRLADCGRLAPAPPTPHAIA